MAGSPSIHVFWHEGMLNHDTGYGVFDTGEDPGFLDVLDKHPENSDRIKNMVSILKRGPLSPFITWHSGRHALLSELHSFHHQDYVNELVEADKNGGKVMCCGTFLNPGSWDVSLLAAGTTLSAMKHVLEGQGNIAYALVRPPGHHAQPTRADGYCFLNNAGLAVHLALNSGCEKVAVVDIDVHHGNGTAEGFYMSNKVLTISLHMDHGSWGPSHPQSGSIDELGEGQGYGYNLNIPLPNGTGNRGYEYAMKTLVVPAIQKFEPHMIVLVVGQDSSATRENILSKCLTAILLMVMLYDVKLFVNLVYIYLIVMSLHFFTFKLVRSKWKAMLDDGWLLEIGQIISELAKKYSSGSLLIVQEGGYHVTYSAYCLHATLEGYSTYRLL
ncbi:hypothetical protein CSA_004620 [Cucumis sativus]|uniref:Uncharacterized protein n=1 Tax=Cucumis sativus TaxID=3659 RepID=A0ACB6HC97_CUCSA|nr:hypothetical protein CSA_004620 [Cucumis sativus]